MDSPKQSNNDENAIGKLLPVWGYHLGKWLKSIGGILQSSKQSKNNKSDAKNALRKLLPVCICHLGQWRKSTAPASESEARILEIRRATSWAGLYNGEHTIRRHTIPPGEVGPVIFNHLSTWWLLNGGGVSERFPICQTQFFDLIRLFEVGLVDSEHFPLWRQ